MPRVAAAMHNREVKPTVLAKVADRLNRELAARRKTSESIVDNRIDERSDPLARQCFAAKEIESSAISLPVDAPTVRYGYDPICSRAKAPLQVNSGNRCPIRDRWTFQAAHPRPIRCHRTPLGDRVESADMSVAIDDRCFVAHIRIGPCRTSVSSPLPFLTPLLPFVKRRRRLPRAAARPKVLPR